MEIQRSSQNICVFSHPMCYLYYYYYCYYYYSSKIQHCQIHSPMVSHLTFDSLIQTKLATLLSDWVVLLGS